MLRKLQPTHDQVHAPVPAIVCFEPTTLWIYILIYGYDHGFQLAPSIASFCCIMFYSCNQHDLDRSFHACILHLRAEA